MPQQISRKAQVILCAVLLVFAFPLKSGAQELSIRTNLLWDVAAAEPNLGLEIATGDHWSVGFDAGLKAWPRYLAWDWDRSNPQHWRNFAIVPEVRYYVQEVYKGFFTGADFIYTHFNVGAVNFPFGMYPDVANYRLQGSFWGAGPLVGWAWWPWQHWRLEAEVGVAAGLAAYDRYDCPTCGSKLGEDRKVGVVPKLALNVAYNPTARDARKQKKQPQLVVSGRDTLTVLNPPVAFVVHIKELQAPETVGDSLSRAYKWVHPIGQYRPAGYLSREGRDSVMYVNFALDSDVLERNFPLSPARERYHNAKVLDQLEQCVNTLKEAPSTGELLVSVMGLASIEGSRQHNDTLSVRRARAVVRYLEDRTGLEHKHFQAVGKGEAWDWFRQQLSAIPDGGEGLTKQDVARLMDIIDTVPDPDQREQLIRADAALYRKVVDGLLAGQRSSGYIRVFYGNEPDEVTQRWNGPITAQIKGKHYREVVAAVEADDALLRRVNSDPDARNAYAVALFFTALQAEDEAREQQALDLLESAAKQGSAQALHNLEGARIYGPAWKEYQEWIKRMKEE